MSANGTKVENNQIEILATYKATKLSKLLAVVNDQKSKASKLLDNLKDKKTFLLEKNDAVTVENPSSNSETPISQPKEKVEVLQKQEAKSNVVSDKKKMASNSDENKSDLKVEKNLKQEKSSVSEKKNETVIIRKEGTNTAEIKGPNGETRRIYIPPEKTKPEKKPNSGVQTRVFGNGGYSNNRNQNSRPPYAGQNQNFNNRDNRNGGGNFNSRPNNNGGNNFRPNQKTGANNFVAIQQAQMFPPTKTGNNSLPKRKNSNSNDEKKTFSKRQLLMRTQDKNKGYDIEAGDYVDNKMKMRKQKKGGGYEMVNTVIEKAIITTPSISIKMLSEKIGKTGTEIIKQLFILGIIKTINDGIDFDTASLVASELGIELEYKPDKTFEDTLKEQTLTDDVDELENTVPRSPVITIMGHVDHGKTSLLDYIRKAKIAASEAGGITQHIGAYTVKVQNKSITFLDTPGHEAFTAMRARGAQVTDIAVIVVAADDGLMPQTLEAIDHAKSANVSIIVAINKMDKPTAEPDKVLQQLAGQGVLAEEWGGDVPVVRVSAKTGLGVDNLLENILLLAEIKELRANPNRAAKGTIIEARLDKGRGPIASILVEKGTLKIGDAVVAGTCIGKIRTMHDDKGRAVKVAGPSTPVAVTGFNDVPNAGDIISAVADEKFAKQLVEERKLALANSIGEISRGMSLDDVFSSIKSGNIKDLSLILKADVQGSLEAVKQSLLKLSNEEVKIKIVHGGVGAVKESDIMLANTTQSIIIAFNVRPDANSRALANQFNIDIRTYSIIYDAIEDVQNAINGMLAPQYKEVVSGSAEVRELFKVSKIGTIAGCHVIDGKILRANKVRVLRDGKIIFDGEITSLKHEKDDVKEISKNFDCGILLDGFNDLNQLDIIEGYFMEQIKK